MDAKGATAGRGGGGRGDDDGLDAVGRHGYRALLAAVQGPYCGGVGGGHGGLFVPLPLPPPPPPGGHWPPPAQHYCLQAGCYQGAGAASNSIAFPRGFADWRMCSSPFASLAQAAACNNSGFHQNFAPCSVVWSNMLKNGTCGNCGTHVEEDPLCHSNNGHDKESALMASLRAVSSVLPGSPFPAVSPAPNGCSFTHFLEEHASAMETQNSEDSSRTAIDRELETKNCNELDVCQATEHPSLKHGHGSTRSSKFSCREYHAILCKELTNSDVGNIGRIVLPKKDAEANLPPLFERDGVILQMDDLDLPVTWKFKYRFWPNNKSRMYVLETTGQFVKTHGLKTGDALIVYKSSASGKLIVRGLKNSRQTLHVLECDCKREGSNGEDCGFTTNWRRKRT